jgi:cyclopropane fatty-acyl-phospholipid synthase-like methyltransferase
MIPTRDQVSAAAHQDIPHANPLSEAQMAELADWTVRWQPLTAIDIGCGPGSFSVALAARAPVHIRAIDLNAAFVERGRMAARNAQLAGHIEFLERPLQEDEGDPFDLVVCIGSSGAVGSPRDALVRCKELLASNGTLVFAELVWATPPSSEFLSFLGIDSDYYWRQSEVEQVFAQVGMTLQHRCDASTSSWARYERAVLDGRLKLADSLPNDVADSLRRRATLWYDSFEKHGRFQFGFSAYVARHGEP